MDEAGPLSSFGRAVKVDSWASGVRRRGCYLCAAVTRGAEGLCRACMADLPRRGSERPAQVQSCAAVDTWFVPCVYAFPLTVLVRRAKFQRDLAALHACTTVLSDEVSIHSHRIGDHDLVVPVPLSRWRYLARGFNQARALAAVVGVACGCETGDRMVTRRGYQRPQSALDARARRRNVRGIFAVDAALEGRRVVIVDDVVTTGATVNALAVALRAAGAASVGVIALAATP